MLLFLDDLQWVDDGSLELIERMMRKTGDSSLALILGYRSDEMEEAHPLNRMLAKARQILVGELALAENTDDAKAEIILDEVLAS